MRILIRGTIDPIEVMEPARFIIENHTGGNIGNMIYTNALARTLMVSEGTVIDYINLRAIDNMESYADYVNQSYDIFLIPLANAFKRVRHDELTIIADLVEKLNIPCCIVGVGIQQAFHKERFVDVYPHNDEVKRMVRAVLDKSPIIGIRGEMTGEYLSDLGFVPEKDFTVIGCPSMFTWGDRLPAVRPAVLTPESRIAFNSKIEFETRRAYLPFRQFLADSMKAFPNYVYVQQQINDIRMLYLDLLRKEGGEEKLYEMTKAVSFTNVPSWIGYFRSQVDLSIGTRIHGNVAAILGGVPSITVPFDKRVFELSDYHNIPMIQFQELQEVKSLYDLYEKMDFNRIHQGHKERFDHYLSFLHRLGLDTIYDHTWESEVPYDRIVKSREYPGVIRAYEAIDDAEKVERYRESCRLFQEEAGKAADSLKEQKKKQKEWKRDSARLEQLLSKNVFQAVFRLFRMRRARKQEQSESKRV